MLFESFNRVTNGLTNIRTVDCMRNQKRSRRESNLRPTRYECVALLTELNRLIEFVVKYSENLPKGPTLLEKTTSRLINLIRFRASWDYVVMFKGFPPNGVLPTPISVGH